ncbi:MAG: GTP pyrophosphokinase [candidate division WS2 bacterium]|nr:GTP pyrophosphokinase [Candidatus Psychracetigena formicireducens]
MNPARLNQLSEKLKKYLSDEEINLVQKAFTIASSAHQEQKRASGEGYFDHPFSVAETLTDLKMSGAAISAALLHDVVEDTSISLSYLRKEMGEEIASIVEGLTKIEALDLSFPKKSRYLENIRKLLISLSKDIRVVVIKFADRLHNLQTIKHLDLSKQKRIAEETLEIYAPLAHRLGVYQLKWQMEDMAFKTLNPREYEEISQKVANKRIERETLLLEAQSKLKKILDSSGYKGEVQARAKHFYSIYKKMMRESKDIEGMYDLFGLRAIIDGKPSDCYNVLGLIHSEWQPIPQRFKDFIAERKSNDYQSLHTTVIGPKGEPIEIQIRTYDMHKIAEYGVAAHWVYKEGGKSDKEFSQKIGWLRELIDWQKDLVSSQDFYEGLKSDIFQEEVIVLTPKGDLLSLPNGSTPVDFAYKIHTDIGHQCIGARVDGKMVALDYQLKTGDRVEIMTSDRIKGPSRHWLDFVVTTSAKSKIQQWFRKRSREELVKEGRLLLEKELKKASFDVEMGLSLELTNKILKLTKIRSIDDLYHQVASGAINAIEIIVLLKKEEEKKKKEEESSKVLAQDGLLIKTDLIDSSGTLLLDGVLLRLARCCMPLPGEPSVGYVTKGKGISLHRKNCINMRKIQDPSRMMPVKWEIQASSSYPARIIVTAYDRPGLVALITQIIAQRGLNIRQMKVNTTSTKKARFNMEISSISQQQVEVLIAELYRIEGVVEVNRI